MPGLLLINLTSADNTESSDINDGLRITIGRACKEIDIQPLRSYHRHNSLKLGPGRRQEKVD